MHEYEIYFFNLLCILPQLRKLRIKTYFFWLYINENKKNNKFGVKRLFIANMCQRNGLIIDVPRLKNG